MIIPCMNSTSAWKGGLGGVRTVASVRNVPGWPGAPGCTMGADCCADAAIAPSKNSATKNRLQRAMHYYTIRVFRQSIESDSVHPVREASAPARLEAAHWRGKPFIRKPSTCWIGHAILNG